jgi:hypothetical protein
VHVILSKQTETLTFSKAGYRSASRLPLVSTRCQWRLLASVRRPPFQRHCKPTHVYTARKKDIGLALKEKKAQGPAEIAKQHCGEAALVWARFGLESFLEKLAACSLEKDLGLLIKRDILGTLESTRDKFLPRCPSSFAPFDLVLRAGRLRSAFCSGEYRLENRIPSGSFLISSLENNNSQYNGSKVLSVVSTSTQPTTPARSKSSCKLAQILRVSDIRG